MDAVIIPQTHFFKLIILLKYIVDLQGCVNFYCTAKGFSYTYICILSHILYVRKDWVGEYGDFKNKFRTSLVVQGIRISLTVWGTWVWSLVLEDPTWCGTTKPEHHNYWACALDPRSHSDWSLRALEPVLHNKRSHCNEKPVSHVKSRPAHGNKDAVQPKINKYTIE